MSGENIYNLLGGGSSHQAQSNGGAPQSTREQQYTGKYDTHTEEPPKPVYSTFYQKGKEYDGTNPRFYKQRDAVIGKSVSDTVYPQNYLKKGEGVRAVVPPVHKEKVYTKPPVDHGLVASDGAAGDGLGGAPFYGEGPGADGARGLPSGVDDGRNGDGNGRGDGYPDSGSGAYPGFPGYGDNNGVMGVPKSRKNFIASNIVEVSNMVPKNRKDQPQLATDRKDFGKVPTYLGRVKHEVDAERSFVRALDDQKARYRQQVYDQYVYKLDAKEQADLIATLKKKLQETATVLASMPFSIDTASAAKKKGDLERTIKDIETALGKLEKEAIFVYRDDPVNVQWTKNAALDEAKRYITSTDPS